MALINPYLLPRPRAHHPLPSGIRTLSLHDHILQTFLPYFTAHHFRSESDVDLVLDRWLRGHPETFDPAIHANPLRPSDFRHAFYLILDSIDDAEECGEGPTRVSERILRELEEEWVDEVVRFGGGRGRFDGGVGVGGSSRAQRLFRGLAEVSKAAGSVAVGYLLRTFFLGWLHEIAEEEDVLSLIGWCSGVVRSSMDGRDKEDCLRALMALRPDLEAEMSGRGAAWWPSSTMSLGAAPTRDWPRRRRAAGRLWWDHENDRRLRRLIEQQDYVDRATDRMRRKLNLRLADSHYERFPRRMRRLRSSRSVDRAMRRSRSPWSRIRDDEERYESDIPGLHVTFASPLRDTRSTGSRIWDLPDD